MVTHVHSAVFTLLATDMRISSGKHILFYTEYDRMIYG